MSTNWIRQVFSFILLVLLQVCILDNIHLFGVATPLICVYFLLKLPVGLNRNLDLILAFLLGLAIDLFSYSMGINVLVMVCLGFVRCYITRFFSSWEASENYTPSIREMNFGPFTRYAGSMVLLHHLLFFTIESLSLFDPISILFKVIGSFVLTMLMIIAFEGIHFEFAKK